MSTAVCIASGPSLTREDVDWCRGNASVIAVNDVYRWAPWAAHLYAADYDWWTAVSNGCKEPNHALSKRVFTGRRWTCDNTAARQFDLTFIPHKPGTQLSAEYVSGKNSGHEALHLAYRFGFDRILLLGYDLGGDGHFFGKHPEVVKTMNGKTWREKLERTTPTCFAQWITDMGLIGKQLADAGVEVVNCSRTSALQCFRRSTIQEEL